MVDTRPRLACTSCGKRYVVPEATKTYPCKACGGEVRAAQAGETPTPADAEPCRSCGAQLAAGSRYCEACGASAESAPDSGARATAERRRAASAGWAERLRTIAAKREWGERLPGISESEWNQSEARARATYTLSGELRLQGFPAVEEASVETLAADHAELRLGLAGGGAAFVRWKVGDDDSWILTSIKPPAR